MLLLIDVDGPLNPYAAKPTRRPAGYDTYRLAPLGIPKDKPLRVWLNKDHGPMLTEFAAENDCKLVWCTTWENDANSMIAPLIGLPELPVINFGWTAHKWKYNAVLDYSAGEPFVWLDDDFNNYKKELRWFESQRKEPCSLQWIDPKIGITAKDLIKTKEWMDEKRSG